MKQLAFSHDKFQDRSIWRQQLNNARPSRWVHIFTPKRMQTQTILCHSRNYDKELPDKKECGTEGKKVEVANE
jgi:hypothetical protein